MEKLLDIKDVALIFGISESFLYRLISNGKVRTPKTIDGRYQWTEDEIEEWIKNSPVPYEFMINGKLRGILLDPGMEKERVESLKKMLESEDLMIKREVMSELGICHSLVERYVGEGRLPSPIKVGSLRVWKRSDIEAFRENLQRMEEERRKYFMGIKEVALRFGISELLLCRLIHSGKVRPPKTVGGRYQWTEDEIEEWIKNSPVPCEFMINGKLRVILLDPGTEKERVESLKKMFESGELMIKSEVMLELGIGPGLVERYVGEGILPSPMKVGNLKVWKRSDIEAFRENPQRMEGDVVYLRKRKDLLDIKDVALRLGISESFLYRLINFGKVRIPKTVGGRYQWTEDEIEEWIKNSPVPCEVVINGKLRGILLDPGTEKEMVESLKKMLESGELMLKSEVMLELGIGICLVERYVIEGRLPSPMKVGSLRVWKRSDIEAFRENVPSREGDVVYLRKRKDFLGIKEVALIFGISESFLYRLIHSGKVRTPKTIGGRYQWTEDEIEEWIKNSPVPCEVVINGKLWKILLDPGMEKKRVESLKKMLESGDLMFKREVMSELGIGPGLVERYVGEGMLPSPIKVGSLRVWKRSDIEAFRENVPSREGDVVYLRKRKDLLGIKDVALRLGISKLFLYRLISSGKMRHPKILGGRYQWTEDEIEEWIKNSPVPYEFMINGKLRGILLDPRMEKERVESLKKMFESGDLMFKREVMSELGIGPGLVERYVGEGMLPSPIKVGSLRVWKRSDIEAFRENVPSREGDGDVRK